MAETRVEQSAEAAYRRGYCDGFMQALNKAPKPLYDTLFTFWEDELLTWRDGDCTRRIEPPHTPEN